MKKQELWVSWVIGIGLWMGGLVLAPVENAWGGSSLDAADGSPANVVYVDNDGKVGVGTTTPTSKLHIGPLNGNHLYLGSGSDKYGWKIDTEDLQNGNVPLRIFKRTNGTDTQVMTIRNETGYVGIGTTSPGAPLQINSSTSVMDALRLQKGVDGDRRWIHWTQGDTKRDWRMGMVGNPYDFVILHANGAASTASSPGTEFFRITQSGNVGFKTTNPGSRLANRVATTSWNTAADGITWESAQNTGYAMTLSSAPATGNSYGLRLHTNGGTSNDVPLAVSSGSGSGASRFVVKGDGTVGIGANPSTRLHIDFDAPNTTLTGTTAYGGIHLDQSATDDEFVGITTSATSTGTQGGILFQGAGNYGTKIHFLTTDSYAQGMKQRMVIDHKGRVGIGTTKPQSELAVNGVITAKDLVLTTTAAAWPDYVFEEGYRPMPLEQLEQEIKTQGRLPDMPSAEKIAAEGIQIADMQSRLLKQVEELTLYVIELKKENDQLRQRVLQLEEK